VVTATEIERSYKVIEYFDLLKSASLFKDIKDGELETLLACVGAKVEAAGKGETILNAGDKPNFIGIVLKGLVHIVRDDYDGNRSLIATAAPGEIFAEALCCAEVQESPVSVLASVDSEIMTAPFYDIVHTCPLSCSFHTKLIENMLGLIANKNLMMQERMEIVSMKSIRAKVTRYLDSLAVKQGRRIAIPFNREELADYLCVERSALSHELSRMREDGLIEYKKNIFILRSL